MLTNLISNSIYLRLVEDNDAAFICDLRNNQQLNSYISNSTNDVEIQRNWIINYKTRERLKEEFYFIICRKTDDLPIGTVRLYDFKKDPLSFCWGSWILNENKTKYSALESALLVYEFGFYTLGFEQSHYDVMNGNDRVQSFHEKMGAIKTSEDNINSYYSFPKKAHENNRVRYAKLLQS